MKLAIILFQLAGAYFGEKLPGDQSAVFAPGIISIDTVAEFGSTFSKDMSEFFFAIERKNGKAETWYRKDNKSIPLLVHDTYSFNDPMLSPDQKRLFFISDQPLTGTGPKKDFDIWYIERTNSGWSKPVNAGPNINSNRNEYYVSFTSSGTMYFSSGRNADDHDIYFAKADGAGFKPAQKVNGINTSEYEGDVFIAPDESYMIVACARAENIINGGDLYISFNKNGSWTPLRNMGPNINGPRFDYCPFVTPDGKYLFYTRAEDIRWINAGVIKALK